MCDYPTKSLCGAAMVYKFCQCLDAMLGNQWADDYLDLVSLALTADVMDLRDYETRYLVNRGCNEIRNPFLKTMVFRQSYSLGDEVTSIGEAFYIAPLVNAVTPNSSLLPPNLMFLAARMVCAVNRTPEQNNRSAAGFIAQSMGLPEPHIPTRYQKLYQKENYYGTGICIP